MESSRRSSTSGYGRSFASDIQREGRQRESRVQTSLFATSKLSSVYSIWI